MRVETIGDATLYLADCREILLELEADSCITDPVWPKHGGMFGDVDAEDLLRESLGSLPLSVSRCVVVMRNDQDPRILRAVPDRFEFRQVGWMRYAAVGYIGRFMTGNECAYCFGDWIKSKAGKRVISAMAPVETTPVKNGHPCPRSAVHFDWLVDNWSEETVIDPFMGSGTTGVSCANTGRKFIGCEINEEYFDIACRRIEQAYAQGRLFA